MGHICHRAVIATVPSYLRSAQAAKERVAGHDLPQKLAEFEQSMPPQIQHLLKGPIPTPVHGIHTWFFSTDGSKGGWEDDNDVHIWQEKFIALFDRPECYETDGSHGCSVVVVQWPESKTAPVGGSTVVRRI